MSDRVAIMNNGVIEQCGAPEDVYERPTSVFAAGFIGTSNLMSGTWSAGCVLSSPTTWRSRRPGHRGSAEGDAVSLTVRPEKIWLSDLTPQMFRVAGTIVADQLPRRHDAVRRLDRPRPHPHRPGAEPAADAGRGPVAPRRPGRGRLAARAHGGAQVSRTDVVVVGAGLAGLSAARDLEAGGAAGHRAGGARPGSAGAWSRSSCADGRRVQLGGEVVGNAHTSYLGLVEELGLTLTASYVAEPGEITRQVPGSVDVGEWPSWCTPADRASYDEVEAALEKVLALDRSRRPVVVPRPRAAGPAQRRRLAARGRRLARRAAALGARPPEPLRRLDRAAEPVRLRPQDRRRRHHRQLRRRAVGEPPGRRGLGHRGADDGRRRCATYACRRRCAASGSARTGAWSRPTRARSCAPTPS